MKHQVRMHKMQVPQVALEKILKIYPNFDGKYLISNDVYLNGYFLLKLIFLRMEVKEFSF